MKTALLGFLLVCSASAQNSDTAFRKWWSGFQAAVAKHDAKTVAQGMRFPQPWENGPAIREIKSEAEFIARFDAFLTPEIKRQIARKRPESLPNGSYMIVWHARGNEYSLHFSAAAFALDGLAEGPP